MKILDVLWLCLLSAVISTSAYAKTVEVIIDEDGFNPSSVSINKGDTVRWVNKGTNLHTSTSGTISGADKCYGIPNCLFDSGYFNPGSNFEHTFTSAGTINYFDESLSGTTISKTGTIIVPETRVVIISPASTFLHPDQSFDLVIFFLADMQSKVIITFDGKVLFDGDLSTLFTAIPVFSTLPVELGGAIGIPIKPNTLSYGVHVLTVKVIRTSGDEFSDTAVYTVARPASGLL